MTDNDNARLDKLRQNLHKRGNKLPARLANLTRAVLNESDNELSHADCVDALPAFVDFEIEGGRVADRFPKIKRHLDTCEECAAQYAELLEIALAEQAGQIPASTIPVPDLTFLPIPLPVFVKQKAAEILAAIAPKQLADLSAIFDIFFERISALGDRFILQPATVRALGFDSGDLGDALVTLAITYAATKSIIESLTPEDIDALAAQNLLCARVEELAQTAARSTQAKSDLARGIATEFARVVSADPATLRAFITQQKR